MKRIYGLNLSAVAIIKKIISGGSIFGLLSVMGCAATQMSPEAETYDVINFTKKLEISFSPGLGKIPVDFTKKIKDHGNILEYESPEFMPLNAGYSGVVRAYDEYCANRGGSMTDTGNPGDKYCLDSQGRPLFSAHIAVTERAINDKVYVVARVTEPKNSSGVDTLLKNFLNEKNREEEKNDEISYKNKIISEMEDIAHQRNIILGNLDLFCFRSAREEYNDNHIYTYSIKDYYINCVIGKGFPTDRAPDLWAALHQ